jgi:tRNA pseudouridine55 synthase
VIRAVAASRLGRQMQVPPAFSARHVGGTRLYRLARRGVAVEAQAAEVDVGRFDLTPTETPDRWNYEIVVSTGTYVRAAVRDLGSALGCGAAVASLRRTAIGPFRVDDAIALPAEKAGLLDAARSRLIPIDAVPLDLPSISLCSPGDAIGFGAGRAIPLTAPPADDPTLAAVRDERGALLGVGLVGEGVLRPRVVLPHEA